MKGHYSPKKTKKPRLPLYRLYYAVVLLLVAVSGTSMWTTTTLAKYVTSSSGSDSARVARFAVSAVGEDNTAIELDASNKKTESYTFTVSNNIGDKVNETATGYDVVVTFQQNQPELKGVTLTLKNGEKTIDGKTTDSKIYTFTNVGEFPAATPQTHTLTLTFTIKDGAEGGEWEGIKIEVRAAQKD